MKKIYLLVVLSFFFLQGFSTRYVSIGVTGARVDSLTHWNTLVSGGGAFPPDFNNPLDTFFVITPMSDSFGWNVKGTVIVQKFGITHAVPWTDTITIGGQLLMVGTPTTQYITSDPTAGDLEIYLGGNLRILNKSQITTGNPTAGGNHNRIHFNGNSVYPGSQLFTDSTTLSNFNTSFIIESGSRVSLNSPTVRIPANADTGFVIRGGGALICGVDTLDGQGTESFRMYSNASIYTAHGVGLNGSVQNTVLQYFDQGGHFVFNGIIGQNVGTYLPDTLVAPGSDTINNAGSFVSAPLARYPYVFSTGTSLCLERGNFSPGASTIMQGGSAVYVDTGTLGGVPTYEDFVDVWYVNLGFNALAMSTGNELRPIGTHIGKIIVNKPLATVTLASSPTANDSIIINAGVLNAGFPSFNITGLGAWMNFSGINGFAANTGSVFLNGTSVQHIGGGYSTTFNNLIINNTSGAVLDTTDETVSDTLSLSGNLSIGKHNLIMGFLAHPIQPGTPGSFSSANMIIADTTGKVYKLCSADGSYFFPIGDSGPIYSPLEVFFTNSFGYGAGADIHVNVTPRKHPSNLNITDYTNRYWTLTNTFSGTDSVIATYDPIDVVGIEANMAMGEFPGGLPWNKYYPTDVVNHKLTSIAFPISAGGVPQFTGISKDGPSITISPDTLVCGGSSYEINVLTVTRDTPLTYTWAPAESLSATTGTPVIATPTVTTTYTVTLTDGNGFVTTATTTVSVNPAPMLDSAFNNGPVCEGDTLRLFTSGAVNVASYSWVGPVAVDDSTQPNTFVAATTTSASGDYVVTVTNGIGIGCSATYTTTATVHPMASSITHTPAGSGIHTFCDSTLINATNFSGEDIYYHGLNPGSILTDSLLTEPIMVYNSGTFYFRPRSSFGCWGYDDSVRIRINYSPTAVTVTGVSPSCDSTAILADGGIGGVIYYQGITSGGTSTDTLSDSEEVFATNTYYFRAVSDSGCWSVEGSFVATINPHADTVTLTGGGTFCDSANIGVAYAGADLSNVYFQGHTSGGFSTDSMVTGGIKTVYESGTYFFRALSPSGCWGWDDSITVTINPPPAMVMVSGAPVSCDSTLISATLDGPGTIYYHGTNAGDTTTTDPSVTKMITAAGSFTYYFTAVSTEGCWGADGSIDVTINASPAPVTVSGGGGPFCGSRLITGDNGGDGLIYYQGSVSDGTDVSFQVDTVTEFVSGTYFFRALSAEGCWSFQDSAVLLINPLPLAFSVTGTTAFCVGDTGGHVGLSGSEEGIKYQLYIGSDPAGDSLVGTGSALDFGLFTTGGTYTVVGTNMTTGCVNPMNDNAVITVNALPGQYFLTPPIDSYCVGGSGIPLQLSQSDPDVNYYVYNGPTLITIVPGTGGFTFDLGFMTAVGTYTVVGINPTTGCSANMLDSAIIKTNPLPDVFMVTGGGAFCDGDTGYHVFLSGSQMDISYQLIRGIDFVGFPIIGDGNPLDFGPFTDGGTYTIIASNPNTGCVNTMADSAVIIKNPLPLIGTIAGGGAYCSGTGGLPILLDVSESGVNYNLYHAGTIIETVAGTGTPPLDLGVQSLAGSYRIVAVNATTGCKDTMNDSVIIAISGLPTAFTIFGGGAFCIGGVGYNVGLTGSQTDKMYTIYRDGITIDSIPGTGSIIHFGYQTTGGTYTVVARDLITGCTSNMIGSTTIVVYSLPIVYNTLGGGPYCAGGPGRRINLSGSNIGIAYQVYLGADTVTGRIAGTGSALDFGLFTPPGTYTIRAVNVVTGCTANMDSFATIVVNTLPTLYSVTGGGSYCVAGAGMHVGLSGSDTGVVYQLYKGTISIGGPMAGTDTALDFGLQTGAGVYTVVASNTITGCTSNMTGSKTISINPLPAVHLVTGGGAIVYCLGDTGINIGLSASDLGVAYQLYNGATPVGDSVLGTLHPIDFGHQTVGGTYTVIGTDTATGCASTMSGSAIITVQAPVVPVVTILAHPGLHIEVGARDTLVAVITSGAGTFATFQWYVNGNPVPGATNDTFSFQVYFNTDSITCEVTSHGPCGGHTTIKSVFITLYDVSVKQLTFTGSEVRLMPNPNKGEFTLKGTLGSTEDQDVFVEVTNMLGQVVYKDNFTAHNGNIDQRIKLNSTLANGMYLLNMRSGAQKNIFHFVVEQ